MIQTRKLQKSLTGGLLVLVLGVASLTLLAESAQAAPAGEGSWRTLAPMQDGARQENGVVALNGKVYVIGGIDPYTVPTVEVYDPVQDSWSYAAPMPKALNHPNVAAANGKIYVLGGMVGDFPFVAVGDAFVYDPTTNRWSSLPPMPAGSERGSAAVGVGGNTIYLAGGLRLLTGTEQDTVDTFSAFNTVTQTWTRLPAMPEPRDHLVGAVVGNTFYTLGGRINGQHNVRGDVFAFDINAGQWSRRSPMPTPRGGTAGGLIGREIFVVGGEGNHDNSHGMFVQNEAYDPVADRWTVYPPMPTPRHGTGAAVVGGTLYVPAGATELGLGLTDTHEAFSPRRQKHGKQRSGLSAQVSEP